MAHKTPYKYLTWLTVLFITCYAATLVLQNRLVLIGHVYVCAAIFIYPISYSLADIITEVYGYQISRQLIWGAIVSTMIIACLVAITIRLPFPHFWLSYTKAYDFVMQPVFKGVLSGAIAILIGQFANIYVITKTKIMMKGRYFGLRTIIATSVGDFLTIMLALLGIFSGRMPLHQIFNLVLAEYLIMILYAFIMAAPSAAIAGFLKKNEGIDKYDNNISFNPFKFNLDKN